jgi:amino acid permease
LKKLTTLEATCLIAGAGIGGGVMAAPYLVQRTGLLPAIIIAAIAYIVTSVLHIMVAELSVRTEFSGELLTIFSKHLFRDKKSLRIGFYFLMAVTLVCNLAAYITGSGEILSSLLNIPLIVGKIVFFILAATVVFFGLKKIAVNEAISLMIMFSFLLIMAALSFVKRGDMPFVKPGFFPVLAVYGMVMFSLSSLFAVPQAASGLSHSRKKLIRAIIFGLLINLFFIIVITICVLSVSRPVTEVAIVGWAKALGPIVNVLGPLFVFLAMLGTFWSISLQLCDMTGAFFNAGHRLSWLIGTLPCFIVALLPMSGFLELMQIAGGATAVIIALMVVPAYNNSIRMASHSDILLGKIGKSKTVAYVVMFMYILMAAASFL